MARHKLKFLQFYQWCSRDRNFRDRDLAQISRRDRDLEVRDRDSRSHISLMVIKANSLNNAATKYLAHCQIFKTIKIIRNLCKRPNTANVHFHFPLRNLQPPTRGLIYKFHEEMHGHWKCWQRLEGLRILHSKIVGEPIEYSRCLPLPCFNEFGLTQKTFNCFVRYKTTPTLPCKDRRWCPDEAPVFWSLT